MHSAHFGGLISKRSALTLHNFNISERVLFHFKALRESPNCSILLTFDTKCIIEAFGWAIEFGTEQLHVSITGPSSLSYFSDTSDIISGC